MNLSIHFRPEAESDVEEAAFWYKKQREGLGYEFLNEVAGLCNTISDNPRLYPVVYRGVRRAIVHRFPFTIYYRIEEKFIVVIAVMHGSRHPKRWQKRK